MREKERERQTTQAELGLKYNSFSFQLNANLSHYVKL
jgi:hypothetical protein